MTPQQLKEWLNLPDETKKNIFNETAVSVGLPVAAIEKDWWVVRTIQLVFESSIGKDTVFKGGTSLSKVWNLIDRFSEDIDLALDRKFLGFNKEDDEMTASQVRRLREQSSTFIEQEYFPELEKRFKDSGLDVVQLRLSEIKTRDQDPLIIEVYYHSVVEKNAYLYPRVLIEIGSRSMIEPFEERSFATLVAAKFKDRLFSDTPIMVPTVIPERTFLEKIYLLHEEFQQSIDKIRVDRKSRHLYDLEKLMDTDYAKRALQDIQLQNTIINHRKRITPLRGIDYDNHVRGKFNILPPENVIEAWERDYKAMAESMFYNESLLFSDLIERISKLNKTINNG